MTSSAGQCRAERTLNVRHGRVKNLLLGLVVTKAFSHLADHGLGEKVLLRFTLLRLEAHPGVEHALDFGGKLGALLELEGLLLGLNRLPCDGVEALGNIDDVALLTHLIDALLHRLSVVATSLVQDAGDFLCEDEARTSIVEFAQFA